MKKKQELSLHRVESISLSLIDPPDPSVRLSSEPEGIEELAGSMRRIGLLNPILLVKEGNRYKIVAGHRRYLAARYLKWESVPSRVLLKHDDPTAAISTHENIFREDLSPVEEANAIRYLHDQEGLDFDQIASALSKSRSWVDSRWEILKWPANLQEAVHRREISFTAARELSQLKDPENRERLINIARESGVSSKTAMRWRLEEASTILAHEGSELAASFGSGSGVYQEPLIKCAHCEKAVPITKTEVIRICQDCLTPQ